jgi:hypothetical protein
LMPLSATLCHSLPLFTTLCHFCNYSQTWANNRVCIMTSF